MDTLLVMTNLPDRASAEFLAQVLVERRIAACVNMLAPCRSVYHWQDRIENVDEVPLLIKTTDAQYAALEIVVQEFHPYELPELIAVRIARGLPAYLDWVAAETEIASGSSSTA